MPTLGFGGGAASGAGALFKALMPKPPILPGNPVLPQEKVDEAQANAAAALRRRQAIAGGIQSTMLTGGSGAPLNPTTLSSKTLLGS